MVCLSIEIFNVIVFIRAIDHVITIMSGLVGWCEGVMYLVLLQFYFKDVLRMLNFFCPSEIDTQDVQNCLNACPLLTKVNECH